MNSFPKHFFFLKPELPNPNPRILALEEHDAKHATCDADYYVRILERMLVERLIPEYLQTIFFPNGWIGHGAGEKRCFGLQLMARNDEGVGLRYVTLTFRLGAELTTALALPQGSQANVLIENNNFQHEFYVEDAFDAIELRLVHRQDMIDTMSPAMLEGMQASLASAITDLKNSYEACEIRCSRMEESQIRKQLLTLISLYRRESERLGTIGNWFGLQETAGQVLSYNLFHRKITYRMDDNLCEVLQVPVGTLCRTEEYEGTNIKFEIDCFNHQSKELASIRRLLTTSMSGFLLQTP